MQEWKINTVYPWINIIIIIRYSDTLHTESEVYDKLYIIEKSKRRDVQCFKAKEQII